MPATVKVRLVPGTTADAIRRARLDIPGRLGILIRTSLEVGRSAITENTPVGFSRTLRGGYSVVMLELSARRIAGAIVNPAPYHDIRDVGRRPGKRPPTAALIPWVGTKLGIPPGPEREGVAYLVARKIGARGYRGARMVDKGWKVAEAQLTPALAKLGYALVSDIDNAP